MPSELGESDFSDKAVSPQQPVDGFDSAFAGRSDFFDKAVSAQQPIDGCDTVGA